MAKLSEIYKVGMSVNDIPKTENKEIEVIGGGKSAPASFTSGKKLSEYYTVGMEAPKSIPMPSLTKSSVSNTPSVDFNSVISEYESLPKTDIISRLFSKESKEAYKRKQELNPLYEQAKDAQTKDRIAKLGLDEATVRKAYEEGWGYGGGQLTDLLKSKGVTDKKELNDLYGNIDKMLTRTAQAEATERNVKFADEHPVLGTAATFPTKIVSDMGGIIENPINYALGNPLSNSLGSNAVTKQYQTMREEASKDLGKVGKFAYNVGTSIVDMAPIIALGGNAGLGYAGASAAQGSIPELIDRGLTPNQIMASSLANGVAEAALEKLPLGNLEKWAQQPIEKSIKSIAKVVGSQMASEATEEMGTDVINLITDNLINGDKSQFKQDEKQYGFETALKNFVKQTVYDGLAGAASGGIMGGGTGVYNVARNGFYNPNPTIPALEQNATPETPTVNEAQTTEAPAEQPISADLVGETAQTTIPTATQETSAQAPTESKAYDSKNVSDKALNKILNDHFNMFAKSEEGNALRAEIKSAINEYEDTYSEDAYNRLVSLVSQAEEMLRNGTYTFKRDANKRSGKVRQTSYPNYRGTVTENVMAYADKLQGMNNLVNKTNEAYRTEITNMAEKLSTANADESAWNYLSEIKENFDDYVSTGDEAFLENAVNAVNDMANVAGINYADVQNDFEQGMANAIDANKSKNKVMAEDIGLSKGKSKQIPTVAETDGAIEQEFSLDEIEDRRNGAKYVGQTATNTLRNAEMFNPETGEKIYETRKLIEDQIKNGNADVERQTWLAANREAEKEFDELGMDGVKNKILESDTETTQTQIAESVYIMDNEINKALKSGDTTSLGIFVNRLVGRMHKVGQALQALRLYGNTASGMALATDTLAGSEVNAWVSDAAKNKNGKKAKSLAQNNKLAEALKRVGYDGTMETDKPTKTYEQLKQEVRNTLAKESSSVQNRFSDTDVEYLARLLEHGASTEDIANALNKHLVTGYFGISAEDLQKITDLYNPADASKSSKEKAELRKQAAAIASKYLGDATFMDKWNSWRYLSMLGNPRTMIRNILGNTTFGAVTDVKDAVGALLESAFVKKGNRTKAILNPVTDKALIDACAKDFDLNAYESATEGGHKFNMKHEVEGERQIFKSKLLEGARNLTNKVLEDSDTFALKQKYKKALAGYLKANGYNADVLKTDNAILEKAREYAIEQAKIATFHADNGFADMLNDWSRSARERGGIGGKIGEVLLESTMPFKKTPANILKQGIEYSPLGMLKLVSEVRSQAGANAYIDTISKGLTGTTLLALGAWLTSRGLLVGKRDDQDDVYGKGSDYALTIGDKSYTIDWTAPAAMPLFVGSELYKMMNPNESADEAKNFFEALASVAEPAINMSMLEGLSNTLDALANAKGNKLGLTAANIASGYVSQVVPTLSGQIARTVDPYRRSTRTNASNYTNPITATLEKSGEKILNKLPGLSTLNKQYVDIWGNPQKNSGGNALGRAVQNFISPGYLNDTSLSPREKSLAQLEKTYEGSGSLIPSLAKSNKPDGTRMTNAEYEKFAKTRGKEMQKAVDAALKYQNKKGIKTEDLQDCIHDIENFANFVAEHDMFNKTISNTYKKAYEAYKLNGYDGVMYYYLMNKNSDLDGNGSVTQAEVAEYLRNSKVPESKREDYFKIKFPKAKEIPSLK